MTIDYTDAALISSDNINYVDANDLEPGDYVDYDDVELTTDNDNEEYIPLDKKLPTFNAGRKYTMTAHVKIANPNIEFPFSFTTETDEISMGEPDEQGWMFMRSVGSNGPNAVVDNQLTNTISKGREAGFLNGMIATELGVYSWVDKPFCIKRLGGPKSKVVIPKEHITRNDLNIPVCWQPSYPDVDADIEEPKACEWTANSNTKLSKVDPTIIVNGKEHKPVFTSYNVGDEWPRKCERTFSDPYVYEGIKDIKLPPLKDLVDYDISDNGYPEIVNTKTINWQEINEEDIEVGDTIRIVDSKNNITVHQFEVTEIRESWLHATSGTWYQCNEVGGTYEKLYTARAEEKEDNHEGMVYNEYTDEWTWF